MTKRQPIFGVDLAQTDRQHRNWCI